jgi:hypothetical protein
VLDNVVDVAEVIAEVDSSYAGAISEGKLEVFTALDTPSLFIISVAPEISFYFILAFLFTFVSIHLFQPFSNLIFALFLNEMFVIENCV